MNIQYLNWDSEFFGYQIGKVVVENNLAQNISIEQNTYKLIYVYSNQELTEAYITNNRLLLVDKKVELIQNLNQTNLQSISTENFVELTELDDTLLSLTFQSGHYSRYKIDPKFKNNEFEKLYKRWIELSLNSEIAVKVIGYKLDNKIVGFVTLGNKNCNLDIGLIAVDENYRSLKIGKQLIDYAKSFAVENSFEKITVATQLDNASAVKFYINNGFTIDKTTYIYHLWI